MVTAAEGPLCSSCSKIPFASAVKPEIDWKIEEHFSGRVLAYAGPKYREAGATKCVLCPLLRSVRVAKQHWHSIDDTPDDNIYFSPLSRYYGQMFGSGDGVVGDQIKGVSMISVCPTSGFLSWETPHDLRIRHNTGAPEQPILLAVEPHLVTNEFDPSLPLQWLKWCHQKHDCNTTGMHASPAFGITLIDCQTRRLVEHVDGMDYIALSYVWGNTVVLEPDFSSRSLPAIIPTVAEDAIKVTTAMGYRYLWIDRYCINQKDPQQTQQQVQQMDIIYRSAELTIVAAAGHDGDYGLAGVNASTCKAPKRPQLHVEGAVLFPVSGGVPIREIAKKKWASRGWTYQEAQLSRRCLFFTEEWMYFECNHMSCWTRQEFSCGSDTSALVEQLTWRSQTSQILWKFPELNPSALEGHDPRSKTALEPFHAICSLITAFSQRQLTFSSDGLRAFMGILKHFSSLYEFRVQHLWGVPFIVANPAAVDDQRSLAVLPGPHSFFAETLCWLHADNGTSMRREELPSWSWAGWTDPKNFYGVRWPDNLVGGDWKRARMVSLMDGNRGLASIIQIEAIFVPPGSAVRLNTDGELCIWDDSSAYISLDTGPVNHSDGSILVRDFESGKFRICIMYGIRGQLFQALIVQESPGKSATYQRAGVFYASHDQRRAANDEERAQWASNFERNLNESGWSYETFWLE